MGNSVAAGDGRARAREITADERRRIRAAAAADVASKIIATRHGLSINVVKRIIGGEDVESTPVSGRKA